MSVRPLIERPTKSNNLASTHVAVNPGYGSISRWFKGSVTNICYFFLKITYILFFL